MCTYESYSKKLFHSIKSVSTCLSESLRFSKLYLYLNLVVLHLIFQKHKRDKVSSLMLFFKDDVLKEF